jgi:hypothetical protein
MNAPPTIQYHIGTGKRDDVVHGPEEADLVITVTRTELGTDPAVAYMQGRLKAAGDTGRLFEALRSGQVKRDLDALAGS